MNKKSALSIVLVVIMLFSLSLSVFAADAKTPESVADAAVYDVVPYNGTNTVYITVSVIDNTELNKIGFLCETSKVMFEKQKTYDDGTYQLMTLPHITGELALHVIIFNLTSAIGGDKENNSYHGYYEDAKEAKLNIDESRLSSNQIDMVGNIYIAVNTMFSFLSSTK